MKTNTFIDDIILIKEITTNHITETSITIQYIGLQAILVNAISHQTLNPKYLSCNPWVMFNLNI